ncbi:MAG: amidohydrolase family protein, partial [Actinobacteria bacterium]|nr:amidohydrolase family protein [Actinomycetota bacterium]
LANYSPLTCSTALLKRTRALADQHGVGINVHVLSTQKGAERGRAVFGQDTMVFLDEIGYLGPQVTLVHLVHPTDGDIAAVRESGAKLVHCPLALAKAGECAPLGAIYAAGIEVSLGSDWLMMDPWEQMRFAIVLARVTTRSTPVIDAYDALAMSTIRAARAVGLDHEIGSLEVGKKADVILVDLDQPHLAPLGEDYDPVKTLVHNATGRDVVSVLVDGEVVVADRRALRIDEREVLATAERHARAVLSRAAALAR